MERTRRDSSQSRLDCTTSQGFPQRMRNRAGVCPFGTLNIHAGAWGIALIMLKQDIKNLNRYHAVRNFLSFTRQIIKSFAIYFLGGKRGSQEFLYTPELLQCLNNVFPVDRHIPTSHYLSICIPCIAFHTKGNVNHIFLVCTFKIRDKTRRAAQKQGENARCNGIEGTQMPNAFNVEEPFQPAIHIHARPTLRFIHQQEAVFYCGCYY